MKPTQYLILVLAATASLTTPVLADQIGDPAPDLQVAEWFKGDPVNLMDGRNKTIYVIEFWSVTSKPCLVRIPALNELQKRYQDRDVVVIGLTADKTDAVRAFVEHADETGAELAYRIAADKEQATLTAYAGAHKFNALPWAIVIDKKGNVVWSGPVLEKLQPALDAILAGTYDLEVARKEEVARRLKVLYFRYVTSVSKADKARQFGDLIIENARTSQDMMNDLAWEIATTPGLIKRDFELAMIAAQIAYDASGGKHPGIVDTYARVLWESGKKTEAIEYQKKAVELAEGTPLQAALKTTLERYQKELKDE